MFYMHFSSVMAQNTCLKGRGYLYPGTDFPGTIQVAIPGLFMAGSHCAGPLPNEPCREKTCLRGFRPGPTQTGLYSHRIWLEP